MGALRDRSTEPDVFGDTVLLDQLQQTTIHRGVTYSSLDRIDETVILDVNNPRDGSVKFRWGMDEADNDWWWAIDNIRITSPFSGNPLPGVETGQWSFMTGEDGGVEPLAGDADRDGDVDFQDFLALANTFGQSVEPGTGADFDSDGDIDFQDFLALANNFGRSAAEPAATDVAFAANDIGADE